MAQLTETGIVIDRLNQIVERLEEGFRQIYGQNIYLAPDSPDGQMIGILAQIKMDIEELAESVYKQLDPDLASGAWLEQRVAYAGLVRRQAEYSYLRSAILTGDPHTQIFKGLVVEDENKTRWLSTQDVVLDDNGSARVDFRSEQLGVYSLPQNSRLAPHTVVLGLHQVVTYGASEEGVEEETDAQLRQRFFISRAKNATNNEEAILGKIRALEDVRQVNILENSTDQLDKDGVKPHSLNIIVDGGRDEDIARVLFENKAAGVGLQGETRVTLMRNQLPRVIRFDRPRMVDIAVHLLLVRDNDFYNINTDTIRTALNQMRFNIGEAVNLSRLYTPVNKVDGFWVKSLSIGRAGQALGTENIEIGIRELARIQMADIQIEVQ